MDYPIIFSAPMVRAMLAGRKTMTRRILKIGPMMDGKKHPIYPPEEVIEMEPGEFSRGICHYKSAGGLSGPYTFPFAVGDRLWVRENFRVQQVNRYQQMRDGESTTILHACIDYEADNHRNWIEMPQRTAPLILAKRGEGESGRPTKLHPSIHMPVQASRLTLDVTAVKVERLQDISDRGAQNDCTAEGIYHCGRDVPSYEDWSGGGFRSAEKCMFKRLWDELHGAGSWDANPEVVAISFTVRQGNIDAA